MQEKVGGWGPPLPDAMCLMARTVVAKKKNVANVNQSKVLKWQPIDLFWSALKCMVIIGNSFYFI